MAHAITEAWLLGTRYYPIQTDLSSHGNFPPDSEIELEEEQFLLDFRSKFWFSYRRNFDNIGQTKYTSDSGWGCMLRSGQMILGSALQRHFLGAQWRISDILNQNLNNPESFLKYRMILSWFLDKHPSYNVSGSAPYSLSAMTIKGIQFDTPIGQWHGPTTTANILKILISQHSPGGMQAYVSQDATIYKAEVAKLCEKSPQSDDWNSVLILLPVRLGIELNHAYLPFLTETMKFPQSMGFAGGKQGTSFSSVVTFGKWRTQRAVRSMYYVGIDGENGLYYLDPHKTQDTIYFNDIRTTQASNFASYHYTLNPKKTKMDQIDPSILIGFYCQNKQDFDNLCERVEKLTKEKSPSIFVISNKRPIYSKELKIEVQDSNDPGLKWKGEEEWTNPLSPSENISLGNYNLRPKIEAHQVKELVKYHSRNGEVWGVLGLIKGFVFFEPLRQDPLVQVSGADTYRWWIRVLFLESCQVLDHKVENEERNSDDFVLLNSQSDSQIDKNLKFGNSIDRGSSVDYFSETETENDQGQSTQKSGLGQISEKLTEGLDLKSMIIDEFNSAINWIHVAFLQTKKPFTEVSSVVNRLISDLELIFQHGLKERNGLTQLFDLSKGKLPNQITTFWPLIEKIVQRDQFQYLDKLASSESEKCRIWIRFCLNDGILYNYFVLLTSDRRILSQYYQPNSLLLNEGHCEIIKTLLFSLQSLSFALPVLNNVVGLEQKVEDLDQNVEGDQSDLPFFQPPSQIRFTVRANQTVECFDIEANSDKINKIFEPILNSMEKFSVPMAK